MMDKIQTIIMLHMYAKIKSTSNIHYLNTIPQFVRVQAMLKLGTFTCVSEFIFTVNTFLNNEFF